MKSCINYSCVILIVGFNCLTSVVCNKRDVRSLESPLESEASNYDEGFQNDNSLAADGERENRDVKNTTVIPPVVEEKDEYDEEQREKDFKQKFEKQLKQWKSRNLKLFKLMNEEAHFPLQRLTYTSKYLRDLYGGTVQGYQALKSKCEEYKLAMPEIRSQADLKTLSYYLMASPKSVIGLGAKFDTTQGKFFHMDGTTLMSYQMFDYGEPNNGNGAEQCVTIRVSPQFSVVMSDVNCDAMVVNVVCQRRTDSLGYDDSAEEVGKETDGLDMIGDAGIRRFYIGHVQKTWDEAKKFCEQNGKQLLDFGYNETENQLLYRHILEWKTSQSSPSSVGFWTSGQLKNSVADKTFTWTSTDVEFDYVQDKRFWWQWAPGEPFDQGGRNQELCIDVTVSSSNKVNYLTPNFRASNCHLPFYYVCYEERLYDTTCQENGPMRYTRPMSKYVYHSTLGLQTREGAQETCEKWDYELAEVESFADVQHLQSFIEEHKFENRVWHVGISDRDLEGEFRENIAEEITPIKYQAFATSQPDNTNNEDCVVLVYNNKALSMFDRRCTGQLGYVLCQFPHMSDCFVNSVQNVKKPTDDLTYLGETAKRRYYLSSTQKTWADAMLFCSDRKKRLIDSRFLSELGDLKNSKFYPMIIGWATRYRTGMWTSGRYMRSIEDGQFRWETTLEMFKNNDKSINFTWAPGEPSDRTSRKMEICIELAVSQWVNMVPAAGQPLIPMLKAANCRLPNYFVCYEDAPHVKHCHVPPKMDFGFKALTDSSKYLYVDIPQRMAAKEREKMCHDWGLEVAEISSYEDYQTVTKAFDSWDITNLYFGLGLNSVGSEGLWFEGNGITPIRFQVFGSGQPTHYQGFDPLDHVVLNKKKSPVWQMTTITESTPTNVLCQFKSEGTCPLQSIRSYLDKKSPKNYLIRLKLPNGKPPKDNISYYIGDSQLTWEDARRFCWSRGMNLLDLKLNKPQASSLFQLLMTYLEKKNLNPFVIRFWTSGKYVETFYDKQFRWETAGTFVHHEEIEKDLGIWVKPPPTATVLYHRCLTLGLEGGITKADLQASNCYLPYYSICSKVSNQNDVDRIPVTPPPEEKQRITPCSNQENPDPEKQKVQIAMQKWVKSIRPPPVLMCNNETKAV